MGTTIRVVHDAPEDDPPTEHDQRFWAAELRLSAAYGLSSSFAADLQVPFRLTRTTVTFEPLDGGPPLPDGYESIHHRDETLTGIGDPRVGGRTGWSVLGTSLGLRAGLSVPLGRTEPDPFALGDEGKEHQHIQFGTGTFDPFVDLDLRRAIGGLSWALRGGALLPFQENEHGYQAGIRLNGSLEAGLPAWRGLVPAVRLDVAHEEAERWGGEVLREGNLGRTDVLAGLSLGAPVSDGRLSLDVSVPVWADIHGSQVQYPAIVGVGFSRAFGRKNESP